MWIKTAPARLALTLVSAAMWGIVWGQSSLAAPPGVEPLPSLNPDTLSRADVIALARERAFQVLEAEARLAEARGRLSAARVIAADNPSLEVVTGDTEGGRRTQMELSVPIGLGLRRAGRIGVARAELARDENLLRDARRLAVGAALEAWYGALHAERRETLARERLSLAERLAGTVAERFRSGDAARLEMNVAEMELTRARSEVEAERQQVLSTRADLLNLLGLPYAPGRRLAGDLADRSPFGEIPSEPDLGARSDLRAAERELAAARAGRALARTGFLPDVAFRLNYEDVDGVREWMPGVALLLPIFNRGQGSGTQAEARRSLAERDLERRRTVAANEFKSLKESYEAATSAVTELERQGLPRALEIETMAEESYRAGKIDLASMLLLRRDTLETRRDHADRLLDAAVRGVRLAVSAGLWP